MGEYNGKSTEAWKEEVNIRLASLMDVKEVFGCLDPQFIKHKAELIESLYCFLLSENEKYYLKYGVEISYATEECVESFSEDRSSFLNFFVFVVNKKIRASKTKDYKDSVHLGMTGISRIREQRAKRIDQYCQDHAISTDRISISTFKAISQEYGDAHWVKYYDAYKEYKNTYVSNLEVASSDRENSYDLSDKDTVKRYLQNEEDSDKCDEFLEGDASEMDDDSSFEMPEMDDSGNYVYREESEFTGGSYIIPNNNNQSLKGHYMLSLYAEILQKLYDKSQDRTKKLKSELFNWRFCEAAKNLCQIHILKNFVYEYGFIREEIIDEFMCSLKVPTQKEIAKACQTTEENVSKQWGLIEQEIKKHILESNKRNY